MPTFFRTHWLVITICLVYTLVATGVAYYFVSSAAHKDEAALLKAGEELKTAKGTLEKSSAEAAKTKGALDKEKALNADLKKMLATAEQERESLRSSIETMTVAAAKAEKPQAAAKAKTKIPPVVASTACREKDSAAEKDIQNKLRELQAFQADVYKRDSELRERQKQLDEARVKLADEKSKLEQGRAEYRWPHNGKQSNK